MTALSTKQTSETLLSSTTAHCTTSTTVPTIATSAVINISASQFAQETHPNPPTTTCTGQDCQGVNSSGAPSCSVYAGNGMNGITSAAGPWILACAEDFCFGKHKKTSKQEKEYDKSYVKIRNGAYWKLHYAVEWLSDPICSHEDDNFKLSCKAYMSNLTRDCDWTVR